MCVCVNVCLRSVESSNVIGYDNEASSVLLLSDDRFCFNLNLFIANMRKLRPPSQHTHTHHKQRKQTEVVLVVVALTKFDNNNNNNRHLAHLAQISFKYT